MKLLLIIALFVPVTGSSQIDFSGVDAFWDINAKIKSGSATDADWDKLFSTPYYKFYEDWGQRKWIRSMITTAYSPTSQQRRDSILQRATWNSEIIKHLLAVDSMKSSLDGFRAQLNKRDLVTDALAKVTPWLPDSFVASKEEFPSVAFGLFQPDGNADQSIAMDLKLAMSIDVINFMAHEAHHFYAYQIRKKIQEDKNDSTYAIIKAIGQLQLEGIADLIDKGDLIESGGVGYNKRLYDMYIKAYNDPIPGLRKVDSLLVYISTHPASMKEKSKLIDDFLPLAGHPHGYYMANAIIRSSGKKSLIATMSDPFKFIRVYNKAAVKFRFSKETMDFLARLEKHVLEQL